MNANRMSSFLRRSNIERLWGLLFGFQLKFNRTGEDPDAGCSPNIEHNVTSSVEGALYVIKPKEIAMLDQCMGFPKVGSSIFNGVIRKIIIT